MNSKSLLGAFLTVILIGGLVLASAMRFGTVQAYTVDSISKPSVPEFSVRIVAYPYDVPPKTTTTIDQYTGKETTITQPGYHVENKSIEIIVKNPTFTPYNLTTHTRYNHETGETYTYESTNTVNLYYTVGVKGHFGNDWKSVGSIYSGGGPQSNAQLDSEYTVFTIKTDDYPNDAVLDFRVQALTGYYVPYWRGLVIFSYDFYGQESGWSDTQTLNINESQIYYPLPTLTPSPLPNPYVTPIISVALIVIVVLAGLGLLIYLIKRK